ncbi:hypothetical protein GGF50DRAFT_128018 [Schizophyllum commune]
MDALEDCFISHKDVGGFYAKEDKRHFAPCLTPPSSPSFDQHPTPSSTAVDSPPNVVSPRTPASDQSTPVYTGTHLPQDADDIKTGDASKKDDEGKSMNEDEDEDADAEGEVDDGEWVPATQGGQLPSTTLEEYSLQHAIPPSSPNPAVPQAYNAARLETSRTQPIIDDASNAHQHHRNAVYIARTDCADLPVNSIDARSDDSQRQVHCEHRVRHPPAVADHGAAVVADATLDVGTHGEQENAGSFAPFTNFDIFSPDLPFDLSSWTATQPERHTDFSPAFSTSRRSPYSFTEADLCNDNANDASSIPPSFGSQRGSGQMIFGPQYSDAAQQLWGDMYANQVVLPSEMQMTRAGMLLPAGPLHNSRAPSGRSNYAAPPFVHARSAAPAGNAFQSSRDAQFYPTPMQWTSPSQFPAPSRPAKGKGKAIASDDEQGPSEHPRPIAKLPSRPRNRTQASSRRMQSAAANAPPLEYQRLGVHHGRGQTPASAGPSHPSVPSLSTHDTMAIASTSRSATTISIPYNPSSFASTSQLAGSFAPPATAAPPPPQNYMSKFRVDLDDHLPAPCFIDPETGKLQPFVKNCGWLGPNGEECGYDYRQNIWGNGNMRPTVFSHLLEHKRKPLEKVYHPVRNLKFGPNGKPGSKKEAGKSKEALNINKERHEEGKKDGVDERSQQEEQDLSSNQARGKMVKCCLRDPKTGIFCGKELTYGEISGHVCRTHYGMPKSSKRGSNADANGEGRPTKKART